MPLVTPGDVAAIVLHRDGYLARVERSAEVIVFVNKVGTDAALDDARRLAGALRRLDGDGRLARVVVGDVRSGSLADA